MRADEASFHSLLALDGALTLRWGEASLALRRGDSVFVPAGLGAYALEGAGEALLSLL